MTATDTILAEGKTKILRPGQNPDELLVEYKNAATAFNAQKKAEVSGKGELNAQISVMLFELLHQSGIPTCFLRRGSQPTELVYRKLSMIPLEVVVRNFAYGSVVKRFGFEEGMAFKKPLMEHFYKCADDPLITGSVIEEMNLMQPNPDLPGTTLEAIERLALEINEVFVQFFSARGIRCADFKLEFGLDGNGVLRLGDELSPDNFRLRDVQNGQVLDKDVFRLDLADLGDTYRELLKRLEAAPQNTPTATRRQYQAEVRVSSRKNILNPESKTILEALHTLGYPEVQTLQAGKRFVLTLEADTMTEAERKLKAMAENVLSNPVIEDFSYSLKHV